MKKYPGTLEPEVPLQQQSIDLPANPEKSVEGAQEASKSRSELTKAMRRERKKRIKELNFLKKIG